MGRLLTTLVFVGLAAGITEAADFGLTGDNTKITFVGTKPGGKHDGGFKSVSGSATVTGTDATTLAITVDIDMTTTYTDTPKLTDHLKTSDFFNVKAYPKSKFASTKVEKDGDGYKVTGKLTLNGKTKEVSFPAKIEVTDKNLNVSSTFKINRHDWNISYGKGKVDDDVSLSVSITAAAK
jgi:polyisoprenoid-binding protein YceI